MNETHQVERKPAAPAGGWTVDEYAALKRLHPVTVRRLIARGKLEVERIGRSIRVLGVRRV
jgi:excisionase family DNA binding protein